MTAQLDLFHRALPDRFREFDESNPHVFREIHRRAEGERADGNTRVSVKWIVECIRHDKTLGTNGAPYRFDNSYTALYARKLVQRFPEFAGLVELR